MCDAYMFLAQAFNALDASGDGELDYAEFVLVSCLGSLMSCLVPSVLR